jgi:phage terminase large subunit-like protein
VRLGSQQPRICNVPHALTSAGSDAVEYASSVGLELDPWQRIALEGALGESGSKWAAFEVGVVVSRQNGKGGILEARELAGIQLFGERLIMHTAHELKTAEEARLRMEQICEASPDLDRQVKRVVRTNGKEAIEFRNGARIKYLARSKGSGRGFTGDLIVMDEAMFLTTGSMAALLPTLTTSPNPQVWYTGSAGLDESTQLAELRRRAIEGPDPSLAYFEWSAPADADLDDVDCWYQANPALGIRIDEKYVSAERAALSDEDFGRERLGLWMLDRARSVIPAASWDACFDENSKPDEPLALAIDVAPTRASAAIAIAGGSGDDNTHIEIIDHRDAGTSWIVERVVDLLSRWPITTVVIDPAGPAGSLLPTFAEHGVTIRTMRTRDLGQACGAFYDLVDQGRLRHLGQPPLEAAVAGAKKRPIGDMWAWHRKDVTVDITPLVAVTLAAWGWQQSKIADSTAEVPDLW